MYKYNHGTIEVICGCMFAGKTEELIRRLTRAEIANQKIVVFKPFIDNRYSKQKIVSHSGKEIESKIVKILEDIMLEVDHKDYDVVAIDEVQFFTMKDFYNNLNIIDLINHMSNSGIRVIVTGLDTDFKGDPFDITAQLMARAEKVDKLTAICNKCGRPATRTQRFIDGEPAYRDDPVILVGGEDEYEARCREHHIVLPPKADDKKCKIS
jgi:thymidine kinase